jgi:hypothetical protein
MSVHSELSLPPDHLLVVMTVDIGGGQNGLIHIRKSDEPLALARSFIAEHQLDANTVIAPSPAGDVTVLSMLVDHIASTKAAAYERVMAALPSQDDVSFGSSDVLDFDDGSATESPAAHAPTAEAAPAAQPPPLPPTAPSDSLPFKREDEFSHGVASLTATPSRTDVFGDEDSVSGRAASSVVSASSSTRRLMGTDEERELQYMALKSQFIQAGKSVSGSGRKPAPSGRARPSIKPSAPPPASTRPPSPRKEPPLPRVASLKARTVSPPPALSVSNRPKRTPTAAETPLFNRLYHVRSLRSPCVVVCGYV